MGDTGPGAQRGGRNGAGSEGGGGAGPGCHEDAALQHGGWLQRANPSAVVVDGEEGSVDGHVGVVDVDGGDVEVLVGGSAMVGDRGHANQGGGGECPYPDLVAVGQVLPPLARLGRPLVRSSWRTTKFGTRGATFFFIVQPDLAIASQFRSLLGHVASFGRGWICSRGLDMATHDFQLS